MEELKEILREHTDEVKRHIDVVKEDTDDKVKVLTEGQGVMRGKLDSHDAKLGSMERNIEIIKNDIEIIKNSLRKKVDIEDFEQLESRVRILEARVK